MYSANTSQDTNGNDSLDWWDMYLRDSFNKLFKQRLDFKGSNDFRKNK